MENGIIHAIEQLVRDVHKEYRWPLPKKLPVELERTGDSVSDNLNLRDACNRVWQTDPGRRIALARWYVSKWGGVKKTSDARIESFVECFGRGQIPERLARVPSWSKVGSLSNPDKYMIFDTRVAISLNAIIIRDGLSEPFFHMPKGQNKKLNPIVPLLKAAGVKDINDYTTTDDYLRYLRLLSKFGNRNKLAEMALFAAAPVFARQLMA